MSDSLVNNGVNIIGLKKNNINYMMTCAWVNQVGYDELTILIGSQSETGKQIEVCSLIGVSSLTKSSKDLASFIGNNHSSEVNKFSNQCYLNKDAILIKEARVNMLCQVIDILHLKGIEEDSLIYVKVIDKKFNSNEKFLSMDEMR